MSNQESKLEAFIPSSWGKKISLAYVLKLFLRGCRLLAMNFPNKEGTVEGSLSEISLSGSHQNADPLSEIGPT